MKVKTEFIKKLIEGDDPVPTVGRELLNIWMSLANQEKNIGEYYYRGEEEAKALEEFLLKSYFEFYQLLARSCLNEKTVFHQYSEACFVVMDGMSFRESVLLYRNLRERGFNVTHTLSYSAIPSDTELFREKINIPMSEFVQIKNPDSIRLSSGERYIWSYFPDIMLDKIKVGHAVVSSLEEMYKITEKIVFDILSKLKTSRVIISSDHGYIRTEAGFVFSVSGKAKKRFQKIFGSKRYVKMNDLNINDLIEEGYVEEFNGYYLVKSRYSWPVPGKFSIYIHGGLSLMECFVPVLVIEEV